MKKHQWLSPETKNNRRVYQVASLKGELLDLAVAKCENVEAYLVEQTEPCSMGGLENATIGPGLYILAPCTGAIPLKRYSPSTNWEVGGRIVERILPYWEHRPEPSGKNSRIIPRARPGKMVIESYVDDTGERVINPPDSTLLQALMRAYVASKYGQEIEL